MPKKKHKNQNQKSQQRPKKKVEFSQKLVVISWVITIVWISLSFILSFMDKDTNSTVTVALITESFGVTVAYFIYQAALKVSRNKYGVGHDGIPYSVKQKVNTVGLNTDNINSEKGVG